ncbi:MAG: cytochrome c [Candidatus Tectimicrobiota bacterium]
MTHGSRMLWGSLVVLGCLLCSLAPVQAQDDAALIQYRQKVMASYGASMGAIGDIMKNKLPYQNHIFVHAQDLQRMSTIVPDAFKKEITAGKTDAKPEIWQEWDKYVAASEALGREAAELAKVAQGSDMAAIAAQVKKVGDTCGDCHKPYRKPKEESYKNVK